METNAQDFYTADTVIRKYFAATTSDPGTGWYLPEFDDSGWPSDSGAVGYGYGSSGYNVISSTTKSLYQRITFQIEDSTAISELNLTVDYDDGYIAYLNGHEVARVNVDTTKFPPYNAIAIRSHKSEFALGQTNPVLGVYLDKSVLSSCLLNGDNVLAVHTLNDTLNGGSLINIPYLFKVYSGYYNYYSMISRYKRLVNIDSSDIPLVVINTDEYYIPYSSDEYVKIHMGIIDNGVGKYNKPIDSFNVYNGLAGIKLRGQSSRDFPKQTYRLELNDENGNDTSVALLGMPKESDWILFGPFADKSQIRNKVVYDLGSKLGSYNPRVRFCELIINGQAVGLYMLTENIKRDKNRVNIAKLGETDISGVDVTGGYIFKYDKSDNHSIFLKYNRQVDYPDVLQPEQTAYCESFFHLYDSVLNYNNFRDPEIGYRKYVSDSSIVDYVIMNEITKNADSYLYSSYFYKDREDRDNRIKFGPLWDYDLGFGNTRFQDGNLTDKWQYEYNTGMKITRFFQDTVLVDLFQQRWADLRKTTLSNDSIFAYIDLLLSYTEKARIRNYEIWPVIDEEIFYPGYYITTFDAEVNAMKDWITERLAWIDANIEIINYPVKLINPVIEAETGVFSFDVYPNPFSEDLKVSLYVEEHGSVRFEVINLTGQVMYSVQDVVDPGNYEVDLTNQSTSSLEPGMYLVRLYINNIPAGTQKIIKN